MEACKHFSKNIFLGLNGIFLKFILTEKTNFSSRYKDKE